MARAERSRYPSTERLEGASYFGAFLGGGLSAMQGAYRAGRFDTQAVALDAFPPGQSLRALDRAGRSLLLRYDTIPVKEYYGGDPWEYPVLRYYSALSAWVPGRQPTCLDSLGTWRVPLALSPDNVQRRKECSDRVLQRFESQGYADVTLFWTGPAVVRAVQTTPVRLDSALTAVLEHRGRELWLAALTELDPSDRPDAFRLGVRRDERIAGAPGILVSWWQVILEHGSGGDDARGSLFFIYSEVERKILYATFGHPEWTPGSHLIRVRPYVYFRLDDNPTVYCLTEYGGAWESSGMAVFDVGAARPVLLSH